MTVVYLKRCPGCKQLLPREQFAKNRSKKDGLGSYCRECRAEKNAAWWSSASGKARKSTYNATYEAMNPEKRTAWRIANAALRSGKLVKQPCEVCARLKVQMHHDDYSKPLEVRWFCNWCHRQYHKKLEAAAAETRQEEHGI